MPSQRCFQCGVCTAAYSRLDHLRRHQQSHSASKRHACPFCHKRFDRADVARRHQHTCSARGSRPLPKPKKRGAKKRACDSCTRFKVACDHDLPCFSCQANNITCTYQCLQEKWADVPDEEHGHTGTGDMLIHNPEPFPYQVPFFSRNAENSNNVQSFCTTSEKLKISFLLNYTDPRTKSIADLFGCSATTVEDDEAINLPHSIFTPYQQTQISQTYGSAASVQAVSSHACDPLDAVHDIAPPDLSILLMGDLETQFWAAFFDPISHRGNSPTSTFDSSRDISFETLFSFQDKQNRLNNLVQELASIQTQVYANYPDPARCNVSSVNHFFTVTNMEHCVKLYFRHWYPHCPVLHQRSLSIESMPLPLLLAISVHGAFYSRSQETILTAKGLLDLAEEYAFGSPTFTALLCQDSPVEPTTNIGVDALQAAFAVVMIQNWEGTTTARRRIRMRRYVEIVSAARNLSLTSVQNQFFRKELNSVPMPFDHPTFLEDESNVRLMYYIFLVDCQFAIFHNIPPRLTISEMVGGLPCWEESFSAEDKLVCFEHVLRERNMRPQPLAVLVDLLLEDSWNEEKQSQFGRLSVLNLFIMLHALHSLIFTSRTNFMRQLDRHVLCRALSRWRELWDSHTSHIDAKQMMKLGFYRNALEYWWLAKLYVGAPVDNTQSSNMELIPRLCKPIGRFDTDDMVHINNLLRQFCI